MKSKLLVYLTLLVALAIATIAAFYSVFGLSHLFAGAGFAVIIMGSILEFGKLIATSVLHQYWTKLNWLIKIYLITAVLGLMIITSAGIYGFLTSAYQSTANKTGVVDKEVKLIESKKSTYNTEIVRINSIIETKTNRVNKLSQLRLQQETRLDSLYNKNYLRAAKQTESIISEANKDIKVLEHSIDSLNNITQVNNDSIIVLDKKILELQLNDSAAAELGPLKYLANLTGRPMDVVINWFMMLLIFVFDPLAVALVIVFNTLIKRRDTTNTINSDSNREHITGGDNDMDKDIITPDETPLNEGLLGNIDVKPADIKPNDIKNIDTVKKSKPVSNKIKTIENDTVDKNDTDTVSIDKVNKFYNEKKVKVKKPPFHDTRNTPD